MYFYPTLNTKGPLLAIMIHNPGAGQGRHTSQADEGQFLKLHVHVCCFQVNLDVHQTHYPLVKRCTHKTFTSVPGSLQDVAYGKELELDFTQGNPILVRKVCFSFELFLYRLFFALKRPQIICEFSSLFGPAWLILLLQGKWMVPLNCQKKLNLSGHTKGVK